MADTCESKWAVTAHLRELGYEPDKVAALVPSELGRHYSEAGFRNLRADTFDDADIEGEYRVPSADARANLDGPPRSP